MERGGERFSYWRPASQPCGLGTSLSPSKWEGEMGGLGVPVRTKLNEVNPQRGASAQQCWCERVLKAAASLSPLPPSGSLLAL